MNVIITGATKGIGRSIAEKMSSEGHHVCVCSRNESDLSDMQSFWTEHYPDTSLYTMVADMSIKKEVLAFGDFAIKKMASIDVLINNAGVFIPGLLMEEDEGALEKMMETNLYSAYHLTRKVVPHMNKKNSSYIVNMASVASLLAYPNGGSYSISKFALRGFSMVLREELKEANIKVTTVMPGATWSNSWAGVDLPESRLMQANDIAEAVWSIFQMSPAAVVEELIIRPQLGDL
jgi:short-subunit dehydrogenase